MTDLSQGDRDPDQMLTPVGDEDAHDDFKERANEASKEMKKVGYMKPETDSSWVAQMMWQEGKAGKRSFF